MTTIAEPRLDVAPPIQTAAIVVATDGLPQSRGALAVASAIAQERHSSVHVIAVQQSSNIVGSDGQILLDPNVAAAQRADLRRRVLAQSDRSGFADDLELLTGEPARVITDVATDRAAQLIIVGLGRHQLVDRVFGDETALKVVRLSRVPVLAVPDGCIAIPRHAILGVDFSEGSMRAAREVLGLLADGGVLELVHVTPRERLLFDAWVSREEYARFIRHSFTRFRGRLTAPRGITISDMVLSGDPARELLSYADRMDADLVAAGSHGHGFVSRLIIGSVTTKLLRCANCPVLITPADVSGTDAHSAGAGVTLDLERARWIEVLDDFTRRNIGRPTLLEVEDPKLGSATQERQYPLLGVTFDPIDQRVEIMLGELGAGEPHLSRSVGGVTGLEVLTNAHGEDLALRLKHLEGQTILSLPR